MVFVNLPSVDICRKIVSRSILIKEIIDVFAEAVLEPMEKPTQPDAPTDGQKELKEELTVG